MIHVKRSGCGRSFAVADAFAGSVKEGEGALYSRRVAPSSAACCRRQDAELVGGRGRSDVRHVGGVHPQSPLRGL